MNWKRPLIISTIVILLALLGFASKEGRGSEFDEAKDLIIMRQIAHKVLRSAGDSTTRILSVSKLEGGKFEIPFQTSFSFTPDSLVKTIDQVIRENHLPGNYVVNVVEEASQKVVFGYAIFENKQNDIIPCTGREQPSRKYLITLQFEEKKTQWMPFLFVLVGALGIWFLVRKTASASKQEQTVKIQSSEEIKESTTASIHTEIKVNEQSTSSNNDQPDDNAAPAETKGTEIAIGNYTFEIGKAQLQINESIIELTEKEARVLTILARHLNELVDRNRLQKEIWEDEGVIVGRSLDVFISRLRKKFELDPQVKINSIPKKGYVLQVLENNNEV